MLQKFCKPFAPVRAHNFQKKKTTEKKELATRHFPQIWNRKEKGYGHAPRVCTLSVCTKSESSQRPTCHPDWISFSSEHGLFYWIRHIRFYWNRPCTTDSHDWPTYFHPLVKYSKKIFWLSNVIILPTFLSVGVNVWSDILRFFIHFWSLWFLAQSSTTAFTKALPFYPWSSMYPF